MKCRGKLCGMFVLVLMLNACSMEALRENLVVTGESGYNYTQSRRQWIKLRAEHKNTYRYSVLEISVSNYGNETAITVEKGKVTTRVYKAFTISEVDGSRSIYSTYSEKNKDLGTHPEGAPAVTIDDLYDTCLGEYLSVDPDGNTIYFDTNDAGVISSCGYVPDLCQDDCFVGFDISFFSWDIS